MRESPLRFNGPELASSANGSVDAAELAVELVVAELFDGLGVSIRKLASLGQLERAGSDPVDPPGRPERAQGAQADGASEQRRLAGGDSVEPGQSLPAWRRGY